MMTLFVLVAAVPPSTANGRGGGAAAVASAAAGGAAVTHGGVIMAAVIMAVVIMAAVVVAAAARRWCRSGWYGGCWGPRVFVGVRSGTGTVRLPLPVYAPPCTRHQSMPRRRRRAFTTTGLRRAEIPRVWYYCQNPPSYYPYVGTCAGEWLQVAPQPTAP